MNKSEQYEMRSPAL